MIGSARLGYSLAPSELGRPFGARSDLDFCIVSAELFVELHETYERWADEYRRDVVHPRGETEAKYWRANLTVVPRGLQRGAIDPKKIPTWHRYPAAQRTVDALSSLKRKLEVTPDGPPTRGPTVRVYRSWSALISTVSAKLLQAAAEARSGTLPRP